MSEMDNGSKIQKVINDDLFPNIASVSDVKQVLEYQEKVSQSLKEEQVRGLLLLEHLGSNQKLHGDKNPYEKYIKVISGQYKKAVADPEFYLRTIEELIPKPPKPIILTEKGGKKEVVR